MKSINRILVTFLIVTGSFILLSWQLIQSEAFSSFVSSKISHQLEKKFSLKSEFKRLEFQVFPPVTRVHDVKLYHKGKGIRLKAESIGLRFSFMSMFEQDMIIENIKFKNADLKLQTELFEKVTSEEKNIKEVSLKSKVEDWKTRYTSIYNSIKTFLDEEIPFKVKGVELLSFNISNDEQKFSLKEFSFKNYKKAFELAAYIQDVRLLNILSENMKVPVDSVEFDLQFSKRKLRVLDFQVFSRLSSVSAKGFWTIGNDIQFNGEYKGSLKKLTSMVGEKASDLFRKGYLDFSTEVSGKITDPLINFDANMVGVDSKHVRFDRSNVKGRIEDWVLKLEEMTTKMGKGSLSLVDEVEVADLDQLKLLKNTATLDLENIYTNDLLYFLKEDLNVLKGNLSGRVNLQATRDKVKVLVREQFVVENFRLIDKNDGKRILGKDRLKLEAGLIDVNVEKESVFFDMGVLLDSSFIPIVGEIGDEKVNIRSNDAVVNLEEIGPITDVPIAGSGEVDLHVHGPVDDIVFDFDFDVEDFHVVELRLGHVKGPLKLHLDPLKILTPELHVTKMESFYHLKGGIYFEPRGDQENLDVDVDLKKASYKDIIDVLYPISSDLKFLNQEVDFTFKGVAEVGGMFENEAITLDSHIEGGDFNYLGEDLEHLELDITYADKVFEIPTIKAIKGKGEASGNFKLNVDSEEIVYDGEVRDIYLSDFKLYKTLGFGMEAELQGMVKGRGTLSNLVSEHTFTLENASVLGKELPRSEISLITRNNVLQCDGYFIGETFSFESTIDLTSSKKELSEVNAVLDVDDMQTFLGVLSAHNLREDNINGSAKVVLQSQFRSLDMRELDLDLVIENFVLQKGDFLLRAQEKDGLNNLTVRDGQIESWHVLLGDDENFLESLGSGNVRRGLTVRSNASLKARLLEVFTDKLRESSGDILLESIVSGRVGDLSHLTHFKGREIELRIESLPGLVGNGVFDIVLDDDEVLIQKLDFNYGKGDVSASGNVRFAFPYPVFSIKWKVNNAAVPILKKSQINISGEGEVVGEKTPYLLRGNINILHGSIIETIDDFQKSSGNLESYSRFIPKRETLGESEFIEYDLGVNITRPVSLKNSLAELYLNGNLRVIGYSYSPEISGRIEVIPEKSLFKFKGHEFILTEGSIDFRGGQANKSPLVNFDGVAKVNKYDVNLEVSGPADNASVIMTSDPPLGREDILSLLTLGVTTNVSQELAESERQSITTIGVGTLLFDQFKINEGISSSLGLRLSVTPEISENEASLIQGKSAVSDSSSTRIKSATKIKIQKKVSEKVDLSVSSTVGGTLEQKQEMNLNYQFDDIFSVEGVYEVKSGEEHATDTPDSAGADLKWRWSF